MRAPFDRVVNVYTQSSPGVPDVLVGSFPCRIVLSRHIGWFFWLPVENWAYFTCESDVVVSPGYVVTAGTFSQTVDFTFASVVEFQGNEGEFFVVTGEQFFDTTSPIYRRFWFAEASLFQGVGPEPPPNTTCVEAISMDFSTPYEGVMDGSYDLWYTIPSSSGVLCVELESESSFNANVFYGDCGSLELIGVATPGSPLSIDEPPFLPLLHVRVSGPEEVGMFSLMFHIGLCD